MTKRNALGTSIVLIVLFVSGPAFSQVGWNPQQGYTNAERKPTVEKDSPVARYNNCITLYEQGQFSQCAAYCKKLIKDKQFQNSPLLESVMYYRAMSFYKQNHLVRALNAFEDLLTSYPNTLFDAEVYRTEFDIAKRFITGSYKLSLLGIPWGLQPRGRRQIEKLLERAPYSNYAAEGYFLMAQELFEKKDYLGAEIKFRVIPQLYPQSVYAKVAILSRAKCLLASAAGADYDSAPARNAEYLFRNYLRHYPRGRQAGETHIYIDQAREIQAARYLKVAQYYHKKKKTHGAILYYRKVVDNFPMSSSFGEALRGLKQAGVEIEK